MWPFKSKKKKEEPKIESNSNDNGQDEILAVRARILEELNASPWQYNVLGLSLDKAWDQGYPSIDGTFMMDDNAVANDDAQRLAILNSCRILASAHPHARGIINTDTAYVIGLGYKIDPSPKIHVKEEGEKILEKVAPSNPSDDNDDNSDDSDVGNSKPAVQRDDDGEVVNIELRKKLRKAWKKYLKGKKLNPKLKWVQFQIEAYKRCLRDGEVFIHLGMNKEDMSLTVRLISPLDISSPSGSNDPNDVDSNGIRVDAEDKDIILGYWFKDHNKLNAAHVFIPADSMIHVKVTTDSSAKRGLSLFYVTRRYLNLFDKWLSQSLKHQFIQSQVAILRSWNNTTGPQVKAMIQKNEWSTRNIQAPSGESIEQRTTNLFPIIDAPQNMNMTMASPNGNWQESEILARRILLGSNGNYNSTLAAQFPAIRSKEQEQELWKDVWIQIYTRWLLLEKLMGRLPIKYEEDFDCNVNEPLIPNYEAMLTAMATVQLRQTQIISTRTAQEMVNVNPDIEKQRLEEEPMPIVQNKKVDPKGQMATIDKKSNDNPLPTGKKKGMKA
jgi:hypothetical protein